jgi:DNA helicase-2/ATP-dependent DNA helicase PcrA
MTIHKSKGKEFDEVIINDGAFHRLLKDPADERRVAQERLALRVAVTRAIRRQPSSRLRTAAALFYK